MSFGSFGLFDIANAVVETEAQEWGDEMGMNLFLDESLRLVRQEVEAMAPACGARTGERARVWILCGTWSAAERESARYEQLARVADVWILGAADTDLEIPGLVAVPIPRESSLAGERAVVVESPSFGAAFFAREAGLLDVTDPSSRYYEGFLTTRQEAVELAAGRLAAILRLAPGPKRWVDHDLVAGWYARLNRRVLETLEAQRLQLRAREDEIGKMRGEHERLEKMVKGYVGSQTWDKVREAVDLNLDEIADREREELTICFCDLVGFTKLSERLNPPEIAQILNDHFARLYNIVRMHGGQVDKFIGDCMLSYFRQPEEAFLAAKKMVQESRAIQLSADRPIPIQVRVGLNTGYVALANLGVPELQQRTVLGEAVNFAQRMQSAAPPHSLLLSEKTLRLLPPTMIRSLEPIEVEIKGKREPVMAYLWTISSERREEIHDKMSLRGSLLGTGARSSLTERLRRLGE